MEQESTPNENVESKKEKIQKMIAKLSHLKNDFSEDIPKEIIHSTSKNAGTYKVRKVWFTMLTLLLNDIMYREHLLNNEKLTKKIKDYKQKVTNSQFNTRLTTREDINEANTLIDEVVAELEK